MGENLPDGSGLNAAGAFATLDIGEAANWHGAERNPDRSASSFGQN
jgi:hypothetical protein